MTNAKPYSHSVAPAPQKSKDDKTAAEHQLKLARQAMHEDDELLKKLADA